MKKTFLDKYKSSILIHISGHNINRFIQRINQNKINIYNIKYINENEVLIKIFKKDYQKLEEIKTIYNITCQRLFAKRKMTIIIVYSTS